ncbi:hypothetical protein HMPREF9946_02306 [Acetobacteraceae bacterium AT-5844]|nr:hypothetical protein HMPREF9946_02306 [Acetobacteraceae bacterium AT-5844]
MWPARQHCHGKAVPSIAVAEHQTFEHKEIFGKKRRLNEAVTQP